MVGYKLEKNFDFPYLSSNISEFWRRWHITLSSWIRDYLYLPLGGNRKGRIKTLFNLIFAMALCGLWHGAAWTFVFWGAYHGLALSINRVWRDTREKKDISHFVSPLLSWALTMVVVVVGWVFFRAAHFADAKIYLQGMFIFHDGVTWIDPFLAFVILSTAIVHLMQKMRWTNMHLLPVNAWYTPFLLLCLLWLVILFKPDSFTPFIYAQF
jgi:alginate O-acetyltransferase complex protein AlgI